MRILIVEDDTIKLQNIVQAVCAIEGVELSSIDEARSVAQAKTLLSNNIYELLILDIAVPNSIQEPVNRIAGSLLLHQIMNSEEYHVPNHIIGITGFTEVYNHTIEMFSKHALTILLYDPIDNRWIDPLQSRVRHAILSSVSAANQISDYHSDLAIVCALSDPELLHIRRLNWNWSQFSVPGDDTIYYQGTYMANGNARTVHAAACTRMGMSAASSLAMKLIYNFRPRYIGMGGIAAGVAGRAKFGDVMVASPAWDWGSGKWTIKDKDGDQRIVFEAAPHQIQLSSNLRKSIELFREKGDILYAIKHTWAGEQPDHELRVHLGPMASGSSVLADGETIKRIKEQHRDLLGIEMETYAVYQAAEEANNPRPQAFSMKSVVDFADGEKNDKYRAYSSYTSAQVLGKFAELYL